MTTTTHAADIQQNIHEVLDAVTMESPEARAVEFVDGRSLTRQQLLDESRRVAGGLVASGIKPGDRIALMVSNRPEFLTTFFAISRVGAVSVPLNTALQGDVLTHMLSEVGPCSLVIDAEFVAQAERSIADAGCLQRVWIIGDYPSAAGELNAVPFGELTEANPLESSVAVKQWELASILFTSGTTGRSKGVMWSHRMATAFAENSTWVMGYNKSDVVYTCLPLFHINALFTSFLPSLRAGAPVVVSSRFSRTRYWREIIDSGATVTNMLGAIGAILWKQAPTPQERQHKLRLVLAVPFPIADYQELQQRFGFSFTGLYGSTDSGLPIGIPHGEHRPGSCGIAAPGWEISLVDEHDRPVPLGTVGELVTRPLEPFIGQLGYWNQPEKTWEAHRNCWFHTGDALTQDSDGWYYFRDRQKDAMRVSGENVSSFEVEQVVISHPSVAEVAVYAVPSELGEDSVMAAVVLESGEALSEADLVEFCVPRLAYFAVPRFVEFVVALPKTSTHKVKKADLRDRGVSVATWDGGQRRRSQHATGIDRMRTEP